MSQTNFSPKSFRDLSPALFVLFFAIFLSWIACSHNAVTSAGSMKAGAPDPQWKNEWTHGAVFYEVFVRSFYDSNGDGKGDLNGLTQKLDYLNDGNPETKQDLGVDGLWLMPIFESPSYHGYDTTNYRLINPDYGTNEDFERLLQEAHKRGIRIIVDYVMNHTGSGHPWFVESTNAGSAKRDWYVWSANDPGWKQPWGPGPTWHSKNGAYFYGIFWSGMPDLNFRNSAVRKEIKSNATYWLNHGVDGFRLDATRYLVEDGPGPGQADVPETHAFLKEFSAMVRQNKPEAMLVGENWTETPIIATYFGSTSNIAGGNELPMNFNFPLSAAILEAVPSGNASGISAKYAEMASLYPPGINDAPFLTNHDQVRLATQLNKNPGMLRNAASILLTLPGTTFLYYGEEVGLENGTTNNDEAKRTPMPWDSTGGFTTGSPWFGYAPGLESANVAVETQDRNSLLSHYRNLILARKSSEALMKGSIEVLSPAMGMPSALVFTRKTATETVLVAHNLSDSFANAGPYMVTAISAEMIFSDGNGVSISGSSGQWTVSLPPRSCGIWRLK
jgi:glycosidase